MSKVRPKGYVIYLNKEVPVTWERETNRYVYNVKRLKKDDKNWKKARRYFDDKVDKAEILNGSFEQEYVPIKYLR